LEGIYLGGFLVFFYFKKKKTVQSFFKTSGESSNLLSFLPSFWSNQCFFARLVFLHKVLCFQVCSFKVCVFPWLFYYYHMSFKVVFWYLRWLQLSVPTSNSVICFPYQKLEYSKNLFDLMTVKFWWFLKDHPLE
jgi:hypothetical protein